MEMVSRRLFVGAGGLALAGFALPAAMGAAPTAVVRVRSDRLGERVWFDPIGIWVSPGTTVVWINDFANSHTVTAYHPSNDGHPLRIPRAARPFASDWLVEKGDRFSVTFTVEGVYDYFCRPHEAAGMVGRIVVGRPGTGPGTQPFDYFKGDAATRHWASVPAAARKAFPAVAQIMARKIIRLDAGRQGGR